MTKINLLMVLCIAFFLQGHAQSTERDRPFTWDNATVYFVMQDRFYNGNTANDHSYGRGLDGNGNPYDFDEIGSFHGGDFAGLTQKLDEGYFTDLGINALWISSPYEQIHGWVAGSNGSFRHYAYHGYYGLDWTETDDNFGTFEEFRTFVDAAHDKGIRVIIDIVMNHVGYNSLQDMTDYNFGCVDPAWKGWRPSNGETWESIHGLFIDYSSGCTNWSNWWGGDWVRSGLPGYPAPGGDEKTMSLAGLPDVITESTQQAGLPDILLNKWDAAKEAQEIAELDAFFNRTGYPRTPRYYFIKWLTDWVREFGVDGFRVDTEKHVEGEAWRHLKDEAVLALREWKQNNPDKKLDDLDFWMTAENFGYGYGKSQYHIDNGFNSVINFNFQGQAGNLSQLESIYSSYASTLNTDPEWNALSYISSHDTQLYDRNNLFNAGTSLLLLPGGVQIYYGDETGRPFGPTGDDPHQGTRSFMNWGSIDQGLLEHWQTLGQFRRNHLSVGAGTHQKLGDNPYTFSRVYESDRVVVAIGASGSTTLQVGNIYADGTELRDFYTGHVTTVAAGVATFPAHSSGILLIEETSPSSFPSVAVTPASGYDPSSITMLATATDPNGWATTIYYTTDPSASAGDLSSWNVYTEPVTFTETVDVKVVAVNSEGSQSLVITRNYQIGAIEGFTVYFKKPDAWGAPKVYYWLEEPADALPDVSWPGAAMTDDGNGWYKYTFDGVICTNLIFNNSGSPQTGDLSRCKDGWYVDGIWYDTDQWGPVNEVPDVSANPAGGSFMTGDVVSVTLSATDDNDPSPDIYYTTDGTTPTQASTLYTGAIELTTTTTLKVIAYDDQEAASAVETFEYNFESIGGGLTVHFKPAGYTDPEIYFWNVTPSAQTTTWPGVTMASEDDGWYSYTLEGADCANMIFSNNGASQTADLSRCQEGWFVDGTWYDSKPVDDGNLDIYYNGGFNDPKLYFWNVTPSSQTTTWPGVSMTAIGDGWYKYTLTGADCANVIFSDNGANQTADLYRCGDGWYTNGAWYKTHPGARTTGQSENDTKSYTNDVLVYPQPSRTTGNIRITLQKPTSVNVTIHDLNGRLMNTLHDGILPEGVSNLTYDLKNGVYLYFVHMEDITKRGKLIIRE
ncbi:starch-binding protein [Fulvivirga imtechensis]|nr:starch-binding protein [Fulvivirga imtechensis]